MVTLTEIKLIMMNTINIISKGNVKIISLLRKLYQHGSLRIIYSGFSAPPIRSAKLKQWLLIKSKINYLIITAAI